VKAEPGAMTAAPEKVANTVANPVAEKAELDNQMLTKVMTGNDVIAAFKLFYDRLPTESDAIDQFKGKTSAELLRFFYSSSEFQKRPGVKNLILSAATKIEAAKKLN
jgi:hypothetical protein